MTMGVERTLLSQNVSFSTSREGVEFKDCLSIRSKCVLWDPFSELKEDTFSFVDSVILCLTAKGDLLVLKKTSDDSSPTRFSIVRKHKVETCEVMEHVLVPNAMQVKATGAALVNIYQVAKESTHSVKKWVSRLRASKAKAKAKRVSNTHSHKSTANGHPKVTINGSLPKVSRSTKPKRTTAATVEGAPVETTLSPPTTKSSSRDYSSPSSPAPQRRSILSAVRSQKRSVLQEDTDLAEQLPDVGEEGYHQQEVAGAAGEKGQLDDSHSVCESVEIQLGVHREDSCCDVSDVIVITNGHCDDDELSPLREVEPSTLTTTECGEVLTIVNGHTDLSRSEAEVDNAKEGLKGESLIKPAVNGYSLSTLRELRSSFRLNLTKPSSDFTRTSSDRFLGHHRTLSAIDEGAVLKKKSPDSCSASKVDELRETQMSVSFEEDKNGHLCVSSGDKGVTRSHGSPTPPSPALTPDTSRTPSPVTPVPPSSTEPGETNRFLGSRFHHIQIRNRKVKCSPRISGSISAQTQPFNNLTAAMEPRSRSATLVGSLTSSLRSATPTRVSASPLALGSSPKHPSGCSTLPWSLKSSKVSRPPSAPARSPSSAATAHTLDPHQGSMGQFAPSPVSKLPPTKSPRLLRIFHRRWQSSSAIKVPPLNLDDSTTSPSCSVPSTPVHGGSSTHLPKKLHTYGSREVAEELCVIDGELLRKIDPDELNNGAWMKKNKDCLAPNVIAMIQSFNQLALLVPSEILQETTPQARAKVVTSYIQIASKCHRLRNYNSLKAVLAGLQCTPIFRLKKTWKEVPSKKRKRFDQLSELMSEEDNCLAYQTEIEKLTKSETSFIPFLGSFLTQLVHISSYDELRAKREKSKCSTASNVSDLACESQPTSPSHQVVLREACPAGQTQEVNKETVSRRRSYSLTGAAVKGGVPLVEQLKEEDGNLSQSVPSSPVPIHHKAFGLERELSLSDDEEEDESPESISSSTAAAASIFASSIDAMTKSLVACNGDDEVDWVGRSVNSLADHDSGLYSSSSHRSASLPKSSSLNSLRHNTDEEGERCSSAAALMAGSDVELKDIYCKFKRRSQSYESLLNAYTEEDTGLKNVLHSTLKELARLSANLDGDSVFSESEDNAVENDTSLINLDLTGSSETSLQSGFFDGNSSSRSQIIQELIAAADDESEKTATTTPVVTELVSKHQRPKLLRAQSEFTTLDAKLKSFERLQKAQEEELEKESENELQSCSEVMESSTGKKKEKKRTIRRSLSYSKSVLKRRRRKKSSSVCEDQVMSPDQGKEPLSPAEMLNQFKVASIGCSLGLESRSALRSLICHTQPNTERDNYRLSVSIEQ